MHFPVDQVLKITAGQVRWRSIGLWRATSEEIARRIARR